MESVVTVQWMSCGTTLLVKDGTNHFVLNPTSHDVATLLVLIQDIFLDYGHELRDNGLLGPRDAGLFI